LERPRLYLDEDVYFGVALALRRRGYEVLTTFEAGRSGSSDEKQLLFATSKDMCIFTFNRGHFADLHGRMISAGKHHCGIIVSPQMGLKNTVRMLCAFLSQRNREDLLDRLIWLSAHDAKDT
jgi:hypothetical protein